MEMLESTKTAHHELLLKSEMIDNKTQHLDQVILAANQSLEDEIAFRKGLEMKMNDMHNQNVCYRNHEATLTSKMEVNDLVLK